MVSFQVFLLFCLTLIVRSTNSNLNETKSWLNKFKNFNSDSDFQKVLQTFETTSVAERSSNHVLHLCATLYKERCACMQMDSVEQNSVLNFTCVKNDEKFWNRQKTVSGRPCNKIGDPGEWKCLCRCAMHMNKYTLDTGAYNCSDHCAFKKDSCYKHVPTVTELDCTFLHGSSTPIPWFTGIPIIIACCILFVLYRARYKLGLCVHKVVITKSAEHLSIAMEDKEDVHLSDNQPPAIISSDEMLPAVPPVSMQPETELDEQFEGVNEDSGLMLDLESNHSATRTAKI